MAISFQPHNGSSVNRLKEWYLLTEKYHLESYTLRAILWQFWQRHSVSHSSLCASFILLLARFISSIVYQQLHEYARALAYQEIIMAKNVPQLRCRQYREKKRWFKQQRMKYNKKEKYWRKNTSEKTNEEDDVSGVAEVPGVSVMFMACIYAVEYEWCSINLLIHWYRTIQLCKKLMLASCCTHMHISMFSLHFAERSFCLCTVWCLFFWRFYLLLSFASYSIQHETIVCCALVFFS